MALYTCKICGKTLKGNCMDCVHTECLKSLVIENAGQSFTYDNVHNVYNNTIKGEEETIHNTQKWILKILLHNIKMLAEIGVNEYIFCIETLNNKFNPILSKDFKFDVDMFYTYMIGLGYNVEVISGATEDIDDLTYICISWNN